MIKRIKWAIQGRSGKWSEVRKKHLSENGKCYGCESVKDLEVHHLKPFHLFPELELDPSNLVTVCKHCHLVTAHLKDYKLYNVDCLKDLYNFRNKRLAAQLGVLNENYSS